MAQWATLYSTKSYPFDPPASGKIAVNVINHHGDEVLKVYKVDFSGVDLSLAFGRSTADVFGVRFARGAEGKDLLPVWQ
jgi:hypothetical protein